MDLNFDLLLRWRQPKKEHWALLGQLKPDLIVLDEASAEFTAVAAQAGTKTVLRGELPGVIEDGLWPGIRRAASRRARQEEVASASAEPWVDANGYLVAFHRAIHPSRPAVLGYEANEKAGVKPDVEIPYGTTELALVEARVGGGNFILDLPERYREKLLMADPAAIASWKSLAATTKWLKENSKLFGLPVLPQIKALVEPGGFTREIANLLHRRGASPSLCLANSLPASNAASLVWVAAGLKEVPAACIAATELGALLVMDQVVPSTAKLTREESDRKFYSLGKGTVVSYNRRIVDPSEFALDVIDLLSHKRRATRLWNASSSIPLATKGPVAGEAVLTVINYGGGTREEVQAHIQGHFSRALLLCPEKPPVELRVAKRGSSSEVFIPALQRVATVRFSN